MQTASLLFSAGSGILLLAMLSSYWTGRWSDARSAWFFIALSWLAVLSHGIGLTVLFFGIVEIGSEARVQTMLSLFLASLAFSSVGLLTLPAFFPAYPNAWYFFPPWLAFFPHAPTVFGPLVVAHGAIFILASRDFARHGSRLATVAGGAGLFLLGTSGIALQVFVGVPLFPSPLAPWSFLAGLTVLGYFLIAGAFQLEMAPWGTSSLVS